MVRQGRPRRDCRAAAGERGRATWCGRGGVGALRGRLRRRPGAADRDRGRPGPRPRDRRQPVARALPVVPFRPVSRGQTARHVGAESSRRRIAPVGWAAAAAHRRCEPRQPEDDHAALLPHAGFDPGRTFLCRQADPRCRADRGCRCLPRDVDGIEARTRRRRCEEPSDEAMLNRLCPYRQIAALRAQ
jgi:hypothetical protein